MYKRLTGWDDENAYQKSCFEKGPADGAGCLDMGTDKCWDCEDNREIYRRLAEYEDSGLSPADVQKLAKAKIEGRLVELPCKVGSTVYRLEDGKVETAQVVSFYISHDGIGFENGNGYEFATAADIGKTVFLTREEAERAVKG